MPGPLGITQPYALLLHDEAASAVPLNLAHPPALIIGAARPGARSPGEVGDKASAFASGAVSSGVEAAHQEYGAPVAMWAEGKPLAPLLDEAGISQIVVPYLPVG